jgi:TRAP-type C4-dicarboxylate transport system substrate-binding protein
MFRRSFVQAASASAIAALVPPALLGQIAAPRPQTLRLAGYTPPSTSFGRGLQFIGDRLEARHPAPVAVEYLFNIMDHGYVANDLRWLVEANVVTMAYLTMSDAPALELAALPFLFPDTAAARAAMDGALGRAATASLEAANDFRVLGYFENGFRHISNDVRPIRTLADLEGLSIRVLPAQVRTFEMLGAVPHALELVEAIELMRTGEVDGQENPFANTVTYAIYPHQRYHTATYHSYLSRPIFVHRGTFDAWSDLLQAEIRDAVATAVTLQRELHDQEEEAAQRTIREAGGEIVELTPQARASFVTAVQPLHDEARRRYPPELLDAVGL